MALFLPGIHDIIPVNGFVGEWFILISEPENVAGVRLSLWLLQ